MKTPPRISEAEWSVMKVVWGQAPSSAGEIVEELSKTAEWHPKTVKTLINRLVKKRALGFEKVGRAHLYYPRVRESDCVAAVSESFLGRVFGGALKPMLAHFVNRKRLSPDEIKELKRLLDSEN